MVSPVSQQCVTCIGTLSFPEADDFEIIVNGLVGQTR